LTDAEWRLIEPFMPPVRRLGHPRETDLRAVVDAVLAPAAEGFSAVHHGARLFRYPGSRWGRDCHPSHPRSVPWLRHLFADSVYNDPNLRQALAKFGDWTIEIVTRATEVTGFHLLPRRWVVERTLAWLNRNRRLAKGLRDLNRQRHHLDLRRFHTASY
jgi:transposase